MPERSYGPDALEGRHPLRGVPTFRAVRAAYARMRRFLPVTAL